MGDFKNVSIAVGAIMLLTAPVIAGEQEIHGIVVTNHNGQLTLKTPHGDQTIVVPPNVRVRSISGANPSSAMAAVSETRKLSR